MDPTNSFKVFNIPLLEKKEFCIALNELLRVHKNRFPFRCLNKKVDILY